MALEKLQNESSLLDGLLTIESELDRAVSDGVIDPPAESRDGFFADEVIRSRVPVLRDRLYRLGYLKAKKVSDGVDETLEQAICSMQEEAGLTVDGWVGAKTWAALQELFAFEPSTHLEQWMNTNGMTRALHRGIFLRLISLGFIQKKTVQASLAPLEGPLKEWRRTLVLLGAPGITAKMRLDDMELLFYLFDIDSLSRLVNQAGGQIAAVLDNPRKNDGKLLRRFMNCLLNIELWLLGYDKASPNGKPLEISREKVYRRKHRGRGKWIEKDSSFYKVIQKFWADTGMPREHGREGEILRHSFRVLISMDEPDLDEGAERVQRATGILKQVSAQELPVMKEWNARSLWGRIWDGAKRVWHFLKRLLSRAIDALKVLTRAAYQLVAEGVEFISKTVKVFSDGLSLLLSEEVQGSSEEIAMRHQADFDFQVFVRSGADPANVNYFVRNLRKLLTSLGACLRILKLLLTVTMVAVNVASGPWGWWRLLSSIISLYRDFDEEDQQIILSAYA